MVYLCLAMLIDLLLSGEREREELRFLRRVFVCALTDKQYESVTIRLEIAFVRLKVAANADTAACFRPAFDRCKMC